MGMQYGTPSPGQFFVVGSSAEFVKDRSEFSRMKSNYFDQSRLDDASHTDSAHAQEEAKDDEDLEIIKQIKTKSSLMVEEDLPPFEAVTYPLDVILRADSLGSLHTIRKSCTDAYVEVQRDRVTSPLIVNEDDEVESSDDEVESSDDEAADECIDADANTTTSRDSTALKSTSVIVKINVRIIASNIGGPTTTDVHLAQMSSSSKFKEYKYHLKLNAKHKKKNNDVPEFVKVPTDICCFRVKADKRASKEAKRGGVQIHTFDVFHELVQHLVQRANKQHIYHPDYEFHKYAGFGTRMRTIS